MLERGTRPSDLLKTLEEGCAAADSPRPFAPLAEARRLGGEPLEAVSVARRGLERFPDHLGIRLVLARALMDSGDRDGALAEYAFVLRRDPGNVEAASLLVTEEKTETVESTPASSGPDDMPLSLSAELQHLSDLFASPATTDRGAPESIATLTLAEIYARQGLIEQAVEVCETVLRRDPHDNDASERLVLYRRRLAEVET